MTFSLNTCRKWSRVVHRDLSFFFSGMLIIYAVSGIVMNHRDTINPHFSIERKEYTLTPLPTPAKEIGKEEVMTILQPLGEAGNYTKHYAPKAGQLKVFLKGGSNLQVDTDTGAAVYESVKRRTVLSAMTRLHYNPGQWWTLFADTFAVGLILITLSGIVMLKGKKGIGGRGGWEFATGIALPLLFLLFF
ncbi:MAG: PepSY-associated TM helix domain-containing protein [Bacteroides sp.]|uniref:PepSY-associated TM helix domain-containing protein n=1 Tax=Bacteroides sp. TaxID=29523 RepID=UPI002FCC4EA4